MAAELLHQIQAYIDRSVNAATAEQVAVFRHELFGPPANLGIAPAQYFGHPPMRGRLTAIQKAAFCQESDARADARNGGPPRVPLTQPRQEEGCLCELVEPPPTLRKQNNDVGPLDIVDRALRHKTQIAEAGHLAPINRGDLHSESRLLSLAMEPIPKQAGRMKDFDRHNRRRCITGLKKDDRHIQHGIAALRR